MPLNSFGHDGKSPKKVHLVVDLDKLIAMQVCETALEQNFKASGRLRSGLEFINYAVMVFTCFNG